VSWVEGGSATVTRVRARDGPDIDMGAEKMLEQGHVRPLPRVQHEVGDLLAAREASHPGGHVPDLDKRIVPEFVRKGSIPLQPTVWSSNPSTERTGSCTLRSQVDSLWQTGNFRRSLGASCRSQRFRLRAGLQGSEVTMARVTASPQLEW